MPKEYLDLFKDDSHIDTEIIVNATMELERLAAILEAREIKVYPTAPRRSTGRREKGTQLPWHATA